MGDGWRGEGREKLGGGRKYEMNQYSMVRRGGIRRKGQREEEEGKVTKRKSLVKKKKKSLRGYDEGGGRN